MTQLIIDKKKYVLLPAEEYQALQKKAALKTPPAKLLTFTGSLFRIPRCPGQQINSLKLHFISALAGVPPKKARWCQTPVRPSLIAGEERP